MAPWSRNSEFAWLGENENGNQMYVDLSYTDPFQQFKTPIYAFMRGETVSESMVQSLGETFSPYISEELLANKLLDISRNKTQTGGRVYNPAAPVEDRSASMIGHVAQAFNPGTLKSLMRIWKGIEGEVASYGRAYDPAVETTAFLSGVRAKSLNVPQALSFKVSEYQRNMNDARRILTQVSHNRGRVSDEQVRDAYRRMEQSRRSYFEQMHDSVQAARSLGVSERAIRSTLDAGGMTDKDVLNLMRGLYAPYTPSNRFLRSTIEQAVASADTSDEKQQQFRRFRSRRRIIREAADEAKPIEYGR